MASRMFQLEPRQAVPVPKKITIIQARSPPVEWLSFRAQPSMNILESQQKQASRFSASYHRPVTGS
jgi:hypothetical protein